MSRIPLGEREGSRLEFKSAEALKDPEKIAREVVAMLNADGGEVWVGLREETGRAVAVEPVARSEEAKRRLLDFLIDTIEPRLLDREIRVESLDEGEGTVLRLEVRPDSSRKPFAWLRKGGRYFDIRVDDRIRPMTREEILSAKSSPPSEIKSAEATVLKDLEAVLGKGEHLFWLRLEPAVKVSVNLQDPKLEDVLMNPAASGNRPGGWSFARAQYRPLLREGKLFTNPDDRLHVEIRRAGGLLFYAPLRFLLRLDEIWPPILAESIVSAFRMARVIYQGLLEEASPIVVGLALTGLKGWQLRPGTPGPWFSANSAETFEDANDLVLSQPLVFRFQEVETAADRCGLRLLERVYEAFGIRREDLPKFFDPETSRLVFPE